MTATANSRSYDLAMIGSGGAAFAAAIRATNLGDEGAVGRGDVHELTVGGDVTGSPDARVGAAQMAVDDHLAVVAGAHVDGVETERGGDRAAPGGDEYLGRPEFL